MDTNKAEGIIYGLAIGDALGRLTEFKSLPKIKSEHGKKGISDLPEPALFIQDNYHKGWIEDYLGKGIEAEKSYKWGHEVNKIGQPRAAPDREKRCGLMDGFINAAIEPTH